MESADNIGSFNGLETSGLKAKGQCFLKLLSVAGFLMIIAGCGSGGGEPLADSSGSVAPTTQATQSPNIQSSIPTIPTAPTDNILAITIEGEGSVTASGSFNCTATCSQSIPAAQNAITLTAQGRLGDQFVRWGNGCAMSSSQCTVNPQQVGEVTAIFANEATPVIDYYTLINANTGQPIPGFDPFPQNAVIDLNTLPTRDLTLVAEPFQQVVSIIFDINYGDFRRIERMPPFTLYGDQGGVIYSPWRFGPGYHSIEATPYSGQDATGRPGATDILNFSLVEFVGSANPSALSFSAVRDGNAPAAQRFSLSNTGNIDGRFEITNIPSWMNISQRTGFIDADSQVAIVIAPQACSQVERQDAVLNIHAGSRFDTTQQSFQVLVSYTCGDGSARYDYALDRFYFNQAVPAMDSLQTRSQQVRVIAGRPTIARAFVSANENNAPIPSVRLVWQDADGSQGSMPMNPPDRMRIRPDEGEKRHTFNAEINGDFFIAGREFYVVVDAEDRILETNEANNHYPAFNGGVPAYLPLKFIDMPLHEVTFIPVTINNETPHLNAQIVNDLYQDTKKLSPIADYDLDIRTQPYVYTGSGGWEELLGEIELLRRQDGSNRYYHALTVSGPTPNTRTAGIAYVGGKSALSLLMGEVIAHEFGHNFSLDHAPCGTSGDPNYPYPNGVVNIYGYDIYTREITEPDRRDYMSYCNFNWVSDWSFNKMMNFIGGATANYLLPVNALPGNIAVQSGDTHQAKQPSLYLSGRLENETFTLKNSLEVFAKPDASAGPYTLQLFDYFDAVLVEQNFSLSNIDHAPEVKHFNVTVPVGNFANEIAKLKIIFDGNVLYEKTQGTAMSEYGYQKQSNIQPSLAVRETAIQETAIRENKNAVIVHWDATAYQAIKIIDPETDNILTRDTTGAVTVYSASHHLKIIYAQGLTTTSEIIPVDNPH